MAPPSSVPRFLALLHKQLPRNGRMRHPSNQHVRIWTLCRSVPPKYIFGQSRRCVKPMHLADCSLAVVALMRHFPTARAICSQTEACQAVNLQTESFKEGGYRKWSLVEVRDPNWWIDRQLTRSIKPSKAPSRTKSFKALEKSSPSALCILQQVSTCDFAHRSRCFPVLRLLFYIASSDSFFDLSSQSQSQSWSNSQVMSTKLPESTGRKSIQKRVHRELDLNYVARIRTSPSTAHTAEEAL